MKNECQVESDQKRLFLDKRCGTDRLAESLCKGSVMGRRTFSIEAAMSRKFFAMVGWRRKFGVCLRKRPAQFLSLVFLSFSL